MLAVDATLAEHRDHWVVREILLLQKRVLKRLDVTARTFYATIVAGSAFAGALFELALAADRSYMRADATTVALSASNGRAADGLGVSRHLRTLRRRRCAGAPRRARRRGSDRAEEALAAGLVTFAPDEIDWDDELRLAVEERAAMSPDALTGMEASLRFAGPETLETGQDLRPPLRVAELDFHPSERDRREGRADGVRELGQRQTCERTLHPRVATAARRIARLERAPRPGAARVRLAAHLCEGNKPAPRGAPTPAPRAPRREDAEFIPGLSG